MRALPLLAALVACAPTRAAEPVAPAGPVAPVAAVLVAGDPSLAVFDNALDRIAADLARAGASVQRLSGSARGGSLATRPNVLAAIGRMRPAPGGSCLVFATSHGVHGGGLFLAADRDVLPPAALDAALRRGCGDAPTVVVMSSCYSGVYARPPVAAPNRLVLTAARADRPSFGCGADRTYTFFDECLLDALDRDPTWRAAIDDARTCVTTTEARDGEVPSLPQLAAGPGMADRKLPWTE